MDPNPAKFPILSYVMQKLPSFKPAEGDSDDPKPPEPHFEISEKMPDLKNPKLITAMRWAASDVSQTRSVLQALGPRPDHEALDVARTKLASLSSDSAEYKTYKAVISLDEMHKAYEKMLEEAETRLEKIYVAGVDETGAEKVVVEKEEVVEEEEAAVDEEVAAILREVEKGKRDVERVDLAGRGLRVLPETFGNVTSLVVLDLSNNQLMV